MDLWTATLEETNGAGAPFPIGADEHGGRGCFPTPLDAQVRVWDMHNSRSLDILHIVADSTLLKWLDTLTLQENGYPLAPETPKDIEVWLGPSSGSSGTSGRLACRVLGCSGSAFDLSPTAAQKKKMNSGEDRKCFLLGEWMEDRGVVPFQRDRVYVVPMKDSVPAKVDKPEYADCAAWQLRKLPFARALPSINSISRAFWHENRIFEPLYNASTGLHFKNNMASKFLSAVVQMLPRCRCLVPCAGWNTSEPELEFDMQA